MIRLRAFYNVPAWLCFVRVVRVQIRSHIHLVEATGALGCLSTLLNSLVVVTDTSSSKLRPRGSWNLTCQLFFLLKILTDADIITGLEVFLNGSLPKNRIGLSYFPTRWIGLMLSYSYIRRGDQQITSCSYYVASLDVRQRMLLTHA